MAVAARVGAAGMAVGVAGIVVGDGVAGMAVGTGCGAGVEGAAVGTGSSVAASSPHATIMAVARTASARSSRILADGEILIYFTSESELLRLNDGECEVVEVWVERMA